MERNNSITPGNEQQARNLIDYGTNSNFETSDLCEDCFIRNRKN